MVERHELAGYVGYILADRDEAAVHIFCAQPKCTPTDTSVAVLAEISLRSPRKSFIFIIKKYIYRIKVSKK